MFLTLFLSYLRALIPDVFGFLLGDSSKRRPAEDGRRAHVPSLSEWLF